MAPKLQDSSIEKRDIVEFLNSHSDFSFEIDVMNKLISLGFNCEHSGTYQDPITGKTREFDIRATKVKRLTGDKTLIFCLAVECKNIRENFPLLFHCMPRTPNESYMDLVWSGGPATQVVSPYVRAGNRVRIIGERCPYPHNEYVAKASDQIGRKLSDGTIYANDSDVFEKISQAINSSSDFIFSAHKKGDRNRSVISIVLPFLIVPENKMWISRYTDQGVRDGEPQTVQNLTYYMGKTWEVEDKGYEKGSSYQISHLELCEITMIENRLNSILEQISITDSTVLNDIANKAIQLTT